MIPQSDENKKYEEKEQEALQELKDNGFTVVKDYSLKWGDKFDKGIDVQKIEVKITFVDVVDFKVVFDENEETYKLCHEINNFWSRSQDRLSDAQDCIYKCVARLIAHEIIRLQMKSSFYCGVDAAKEAFNAGIEGFPPIDGSCGIELTYCDDFELRDLDVFFERKTIDGAVSPQSDEWKITRQDEGIVS